MQDRVIGKKVFKIKASPVKVFVIHIEVITMDRNLHRITISNMFNPDTMKRKSGGIQIPFPKVSHRWCVIALDVQAVLEGFTKSPFHSFRSFQFCSWLTVRSVYTSDLKFSLQNLPRDMAMSHALDSSVFEMVWLPKEPSEPDADIMPLQKPIMDRTSVGGASSPTPAAAAAAATLASSSSPRAVPSPTNLAPGPPLSKPAPQPIRSLVESATTTPVTSPAVEAAVEAETRAVHHATRKSSTSLHTTAPADGFAMDAASLTLKRIHTFTGQYTRVLAWAPNSEELVFAAASVVVAMKTDGSTQRFFFGHTAHVCAFAFDFEGTVMASVQEGKQAVVRVWDYHSGVCAAVLNAHAGGMACVSISPDGRALVAVGVDGHNRQLVVIWNIWPLRDGKKAEVVVRQTTDYNIRCIRFSTYEEDQLVACGRDSVRFYRLKAGQLRGVSVRLSAPDRKVTSYADGISASHLGPNIFTDIAFETGLSVHSGGPCRVYVSSASGAVFEINYRTRALLCVYQLHSSAINSLVVHDSFCVTGSDDKLLRVWPMDFSDFLMEADHEASVTSVGVAKDGLRVCIGTESGALGILDIPTQRYRTLLRSHTGTVMGVAIDHNSSQYCTVSTDGSIRVWDSHTHEQLVEFDAPGEEVVAVAYHPRHREIAVGFENGRVRIFDISAATLVQEHKQHRGRISQVLFSTDGNWLYSAGYDGGLCVYDVIQVYNPVKFLPAGSRGIKICISISQDGRFVATVSRDQFRHITSLLLFHGATLEPFMRIETDAESYSKLTFSHTGKELWALTDCNQIDRYELQEGQLIQRMEGAHRLDAHCLVADPLGRCVVSAGADQQVKLWSLRQDASTSGAAFSTMADFQVFLGHPGAIQDAAFRGDQLITVGEFSAVLIWAVQGSTPNKQVSTTHAASTTSPNRKSTALLKASSPPSTRQWLPAGPGTVLPSQLLPSRSQQQALNDPQGHGSREGQIHTGVVSGNQLGHQADQSVSTATQPQGNIPAVNTAEVPPRGMMIAHLTAPVHSTQECTAELAVQVGGVTGAAPLQSPASAALRHDEEYSLTASQPARDAAGSSTHVIASPQHITAATAAGAASPSSGSIPPGPYPSSMCSMMVGYTPSGGSCNVVWRPSEGLFAYGVENTVVIEDLGSRKQRYLTHHTSPVRCLALSMDATRMAVASVAPEPASGYADISIWDLESGHVVALLQYHPAAVQALAFSSTDRFLVSVGRDPERAVVVWDLLDLNAAGGSGRLVAVGRTREITLSVAWLPQRPLPQYVTAGGDGLLLWTLRADCLELMPLDLPQARMREHVSESAACTAVAAEEGGNIFVATSAGCVYQIKVNEGGIVEELLQVVEMTASSFITQLRVSSQAAAVGTREGVVTSFSRWHGANGVWQRRQEVTVDGGVEALWLEGSMQEAVCASSSSTIWYLDLPHLTKVPLVCGHSGTVLTLTTAPHLPGVIASTSGAGSLRIWHLEMQAEPLVEFQSSSPCMCVSFIPSEDGLIAGYLDGTLRLFNIQSHDAAVAAWTSARHASPVVDVLPHPSRPLVISAGRDGALAVTELHTSRLVVYADEFLRLASGRDVLGSPGKGGSTSLEYLGDGGGWGDLQALAVSMGNGSMAAAAWRTHFVVFATPWDEIPIVTIATYRCPQSPGSLSKDVPACIQFVPGSPRTLAYTSPLLLGKVIIYDFRLSKVIRSVGLTQMVRSMHLGGGQDGSGGEGSMMVFGGMGGSAFLVDVSSGRWTELTGHLAHVQAVQFTCDSRWLVTACKSVLEVWDVDGHFHPTEEQVSRSKLLVSPPVALAWKQS
ncbi:hypothetical protein CEUSTIGMA_g330.t1 [Chlamydomonas eustigma]|uniref:CFA20 domain-containing protein n=1 Tax=Chlamydomonas eustigma TaxID=1157962 RepID=A0A250WPV0_9CHLO|nr:hypothetical protein CEUSTIGMA_g330.t1 [Chlamydomonas eustigma]|eukprot:GAX72875.1 hypothetical protein CEUSTIGMA_g330.t1 [Chlamydomonas eustigma]